MIFTCQFLEAMGAAGLVSDAEIISDGKLHRFHVQGDRHHTLNGWYVLYDDVGIQAGAFGCWKRGISHTWCSKQENSLSPEERDAWKHRMTEARQKRFEEQNRLHAECRRKSEKIWNNAKPASNSNPYLTLKGVHAYGVRALGNLLIVPVRDMKGTLHGLQFIPPDGQEKKFIGHTAKTGHFHGIGKAKEQKTFLICEGYATGASLHEATGHAVAVAFDSGNLKPVAIELRKEYPGYRLILCADNDEDKPDNPGVTKANDAAKSVQGYLAVPEFRNLTKPVLSVSSVRQKGPAQDACGPDTYIFDENLEATDAK